MVPGTVGLKVKWCNIRDPDGYTLKDDVHACCSILLAEQSVLLEQSQRTI